LLAGEFAGGVRIGVVFLGHGHDELEVDVQADVMYDFVHVFGYLVSLSG
jgi:hypothetical protein